MKDRQNQPGGTPIITPETITEFLKIVQDSFNRVVNDLIDRIEKYLPPPPPPPPPPDGDHTDETHTTDTIITSDATDTTDTTIATDTTSTTDTTLQTDETDTTGLFRDDWSEAPTKTYS